MPGQYRFTRDERIRRQRDFDVVYEEGRTVRLPAMILRVRPNGLAQSRLGLSVGRRVGNAVTRNRIKRLLREVWRLNKSMLTVPCDIVVIPRPGADRWCFADLQPVLQRGLEAAGKALGGG